MQLGFIIQPILPIHSTGGVGWKIQKNTENKKCLTLTPTYDIIIVPLQESFFLHKILFIALRGALLLRPKGRRPVWLIEGGSFTFG